MTLKWRSMMNQLRDLGLNPDDLQVASSVFGTHSDYLLQ